MLETAIVASAVGYGMTFFIWTVICLLESTYNSSFKRIITFKFLADWLDEMKDTFTYRGFLLFGFILSVLFFGLCYDAIAKIDLEKNGKCICRCKKCAELQRKVDALIEYISLDEDEIEELSKTNAKKKPQD